MNTAQKVLSGFMYCGLMFSDSCSEKCPYKGEPSCKARFMDDARIVAQASAPRLISASDFSVRIMTDDAGFLPAWIEYRIADGLPRGEDGWAIINRRMFEDTNFNFKRYWTKKPDDTTRKTTKWW